MLSAAAGLFVNPAKGPVGANYGIDECRFLRPIYHGDTIQVRLTCQEKRERDWKGKEHPAGVVKWYEEIFDQEGELVAFATILTLVQKKNPFVPVDSNYIASKLLALTEETKAEWGIMTAQHMVEHLEYWMQIALGQIPCDILTPADKIEKYQEFLWNHRPMDKGFQHALLRKGKTEDLRFSNLDEAKKALIKLLLETETYFKENPEGTLKNPTFGNLGRYEWSLLMNKHVNHHFKQFGLI